MNHFYQSQRDFFNSALAKRKRRYKPSFEEENVDQIKA